MSLPVFHKLLSRQIKKATGNKGEISLDNIDNLLRAVSQAYEEYDISQNRSDRATELMSEELISLNQQIREDAKQKEESLKVAVEEATKKLIESNIELERFAYVCSHDLQEPLRMISNFSTLLSTQYKDKLDKEGLKYLSILEDGAVRMQVMVSDLLEYARVGSEGTRFASVNTMDELQHALINLSTAFRESKAEITYEGLPIIVGNAVQFMRLIQNLISNAIKYQNGEGTPKIHIGVKNTDNEWVFSVTDNGIGIEKEFLDRIFEPFKRLHTWKKYQGTGIGLAVCTKIVENHGGKIWATSKLGEGSTFYFTIAKDLPIKK